MKSLVTGGAGFIGSNLVDELTRIGQEVVVFDNFITGRRLFLQNFEGVVIVGDCRKDKELLRKAMDGVHTVYHLAANADIRDGWKHPRLDHEQNVVATLNVLEAASEAGVEEIVFSSTGSIYGEANIFPTPEDSPILLQTSLYGASKISAEAFIDAYGEAKKIKATIFRLVSVLGPRYTHGHVLDFVKQLKEHPESLSVLGNGNQKKSYMHVNDCVRALVSLRSDNPVEVFNLGHVTACTVKESISWIIDELNLSPRISFGVEDRGWIGDNPIIQLDCRRAESRGWTAERSIELSVRDTVKWLLENWQNI